MSKDTAVYLCMEGQLKLRLHFTVPLIIKDVLFLLKTFAKEIFCFKYYQFLLKKKNSVSSLENIFNETVMKSNGKTDNSKYYKFHSSL